MTPEELLDEWTDGTRLVSLHSGDPGDTGAAESAVVRRAVVTGGQWSAYREIGDGLETSTEVRIQWPPAIGSGRLTHIGFWDGTEWLGGEQLETPVEVEAGDEPYADIDEILLRAVPAEPEE